MGSLYDDVGEFHRKFELPTAGDTLPRMLDLSDLLFRNAFMLEELTEFNRAASQGDLAKMLDALVDLTYVILGTVHLKGMPFDEAWAAVHHANMLKERAAGAADVRSVRGHVLDVIKPLGWAAPDIEAIIERRRLGR